MDNIDTHFLESHAKKERIPVQLSLVWSDGADETVVPPLESPATERGGAGLDAATKMQQQNALIEAQAGRTKVVCLSLLGIGLIALHFY